jgi:hypothetical protein
MSEAEGQIARQLELIEGLIIEGRRSIGQTPVHRLNVEKAANPRSSLRIVLRGRAKK